MKIVLTKFINFGLIFRISELAFIHPIHKLILASYSGFRNFQYFVTYIVSNLYFREIHKMIEELEKTESTWSRLPIAGRNKAMLQKWKKELKVSTLLTYSLLKA